MLATAREALPASLPPAHAPALERAAAKALSAQAPAAGQNVVSKPKASRQRSTTDAPALPWDSPVGVHSVLREHMAAEHLAELAELLIADVTS